MGIQLLTVEDAAKRLSLDKMTVYRAVWAGEIAWVNLGQAGKRARVRISEAALDAYVAAREVPVPVRRGRSAA